MWRLDELVPGAQTSRACGAFHFLTLQPTSEVHLMLLSWAQQCVPCIMFNGRRAEGGASRLMTSLAGELRVPSFCAALIRGAMERDSFASLRNEAAERRRDSTKQQRRVCLGWRGQGRMDGQIGVIKRLNIKQIEETRGQMPCRKHLWMSKQRYVCERATGRLMDDPVYQPEAYKKQGCVG